MKKFKIIEPVLDTRCEFIVGSQASCHSYILKKYNDDAYDFSRGVHCHGYNSEKQAFFRYIWLKEFNHDPESMNVLVHEITHLVDRAFDNKGIDGSVDNTEVRASYMGFWVREFLKKIK